MKHINVGSICGLEGKKRKKEKEDYYLRLRLISKKKIITFSTAFAACDSNQPKICNVR